MPSKLSSETARQRELYKYWQPHTSIFPQAEYDSTFNQDYQPRASYDAALTAYAQLGALRLNAKRGMVSVVDQNFQYIIAEGTKSLSLQHGTALDPDDQLWFGLRTIPRAMGICAAALGEFTILEAADEAPRCETEYEHQYVIDDLSKHPTFQNQPFVCGAPYLRFYAGVPIRSPAGYLIGIYSIVDDKPRYDFGQKDIDILKDLAATVMDHLVLNTVRGQHTRSARMVKGLGLFVEGKSSLRDWFLRSGHLGNGPTAHDGSRGEWTLSEQADAEFGVEVPKSLPSGLATLRNSSNLMSPTKLVSEEDISHIVTPLEANVQSDSSSHSTTADSIPTSRSSNTTFSTTPISASESDATNSQGDQSGNNTPLQTTFGKSEHQPATDSTGMQQSSPLQNTQNLFLRASHLIRESLSVEGCAFLDASNNSFDYQLANTFEGTPSSTSSGTSGSKSRESLCEVLGVSVKNRPAQQEAEEQFFSFSADYLERFLERYPQGKIFNFEDDGTFSSSEDDSNDTALNGDKTALQFALRKNLSKSNQFKRQASEEKDMSRLLAVLPGIRSMAFFPLWDAETKRWSAAGFAWTKDPIRILDEDEDLTYLSTFCNNIMAEKARIDAKMADKMKGDFISSVSHELRSPLHGILASAEHLQDMSLGAAQDELIGMINSCSRMLMDTIDSVLDFTKIKNAKKPDVNKKCGARSESPKHASTNDLAAETSEVDLSILIEEAVENVLSGYNFGKAKSAGSIAYNSQPVLNTRGEEDPSDITQRSRVMVIVNIDWRASWLFKSQAGAWRRILMNLFGNALKYTESGQIRVWLKCQDSGSKRDGKVSTVTLCVSDSGRGISNEFLRNHLFTPFTQEDSLTPGTGLGLSIVRQLVDDLKGVIEIKSERNVGTEATVKVTFQNASSFESGSGGSDASIRTVTKPLHGLAACLVDFNFSPDVEEPVMAHTTNATRTLSLHSFLRNYLGQWCGMEILEAKTLHAVVADVHILLETEFGAILSSETAGQMGVANMTSQQTNLLGEKAVLVLCTSSKSQEQAILENKYPIVFVHQPFGPYKLTKALQMVLKKKATPATETSQLELTPSQQSLIAATSVPHTLANVASTGLKEQTAVPGPILGQSYPDKPILISKDTQLHPKRPTVLLVDDNDINLKLLIMYMGKIGLPFESASNGLEAFHKFQKSAPDIKIILMDISMPIMDGLTSTREIRKYEQENGMKPSTIIAVTGAASVQARKEASVSGVDQFLTKPVPLKILKGLIEEWEAKND